MRTSTTTTAAPTALSRVLGLLTLLSLEAFPASRTKQAHRNNPRESTSQWRRQEWILVHVTKEVAALYTRVARGFSDCSLVDQQCWRTHEASLSRSYGRLSSCARLTSVSCAYGLGSRATSDVSVWHCVCHRSGSVHW